ncbi:MAG: glycosyltransferase, partial [Sandaracinaceae bacterium]|nr:glycosyltransferase [Sandaracinaceae bacterium]
SEMLRFFNRCQIQLGFGDMFFSRWLTNLKGRDFEVPAVGRALYVTTYNADLAECFEIGREILCYRGIDELLELLRRFLRDPERCREMARRARERVIREHQWKHRFESLLRFLGMLEEAGAEEGKEREGVAGASQ